MKTNAKNAVAPNMSDVERHLTDLRHLSWSLIRHSSGTAGSFLKAREETGSVRSYYKLSDFDSMKGVVGHECVNEIIAARLLTHMGIPHLSYTLLHALIEIDGREYETWLCRSEDFKRPGESKLALEDYYQSERMPGETPIEFCERMGWRDYIDRMLTVDYLILNRDRHGANIEVLRDRKEHTIRPAPLFDHGLSFACRCRSDEELRRFDVMEDKRIQSFVGGNSALDNLELLSPGCLNGLSSIDTNTLHTMTDDLEGILSGIHLRKIREMIKKRWRTLEMLRDKR